MTIDPRPAVIPRRLAGVERVLPVTGGKGGIGKSVVASLLALTLARDGRRVGLLDLDLTSPCDHLILGVPAGFPDEEFGVDPLERAGVRFLSIGCFSPTSPAPLRGGDLSGALLELFAITRWGELDALIIDMPPGLGDVTLDALRWLRRAEYLVVATESTVVRETVRRTLALLQELEADLAGVVENMARRTTSAVRELAETHDLPYLGAVPWDDGLEDALGDPDSLLETSAARAVSGIARRLFNRSAEAAPR